jgi:hypothetical protein
MSVSKIHRVRFAGHHKLWPPHSGVFSYDAIYFAWVRAARRSYRHEAEEGEEIEEVSPLEFMSQTAEHLVRPFAFSASGTSCRSLVAHYSFLNSSCSLAHVTR